MLATEEESFGAQKRSSWAHTHSAWATCLEIELWVEHVACKLQFGAGREILSVSFRNMFASCLESNTCDIMKALLIGNFSCMPNPGKSENATRVSR